MESGRNMIQALDGSYVEMPKYLSRKTVWALQIKSVQRDEDDAAAEHRDTDGSARLHFVDPRYASLRVEQAYMRKHDPKPGGYYVVYQDGYASWSPAEAFDGWHTCLP